MKFFKRILDFLYPGRCPVCHEIIVPAGAEVCESCIQKLSYVQEPYCMKCGKPLLHSEREYCDDCSTNRRYFSEGRAVFLYDDVIKMSIYQFKYGGRQEYAGFYAGEMEKRYGRKIKSWHADALVPIPLHKDRKKKRGYNQAALIAKALGKRTELPVIEDLLIRERKTVPQKNLSAKERENNLKKAFKIGRNDVKLNSVILIDDIYTTGSTINAATQCLLESGVKKIYFLVLSIGKNA